MFNEELIYEEDQQEMMFSSSTQMSTSLFSLPPSFTSLPSSLGLGSSCHNQSLLKAFNTSTNLPLHDHHDSLLIVNDSSLITSSSSTPKQSEDGDYHHLNISHLGGSIMQRSSANLWFDVRRSNNNIMIGGEDEHHHHIGVSAMKMKKIKTRRKMREPRFCFKTLSDVDVLDDGYKWRKYGQKVVKNTQHPRSYYRCTQDNCRVKKRVERLAEDPRMVITTYEGRHVHSPSLDLDETRGPSSSSLNNFFW